MRHHIMYPASGFKKRKIACLVFWKDCKFIELKTELIQSNLLKMYTIKVFNTKLIFMHIKLKQISWKKKG